MITTFEVVVAHFADVFFNHIHTASAAGVGKKSDGSSLTDEYRRQVQAFLLGVKNDEQCYKDAISTLHKHFAAYYSALSFAQFVDRVVAHFVPEEYFSRLTSTEKDEALSSIVCDMVSGLAVFCTSHEMLRRIIDEHDTHFQTTIRMIQDQGVTLLLGKRDLIHNQFMKKLGQARDSVSMDIVEDMKKALRRLVKEKAGEAARAEKLSGEVKALKHQLRVVKNREAKFVQLVKLLRAGGLDGSEAVLPREDTVGEGADDDPLDPGVPEPNDLAEDDRPAVSFRARQTRQETSRPKPGKSSDSKRTSRPDTARPSATHAPPKPSKSSRAPVKPVTADFFRSSSASVPTTTGAPEEKSLVAMAVAHTGAPARAAQPPGAPSPAEDKKDEEDEDDAPLTLLLGGGKASERA